MTESVICLVGGVASVGAMVYAGIREAIARRRRASEQTLSMEPYFDGEVPAASEQAVKPGELVGHP